MNLRKLIDTVIDSAPEDWHLIADAPSYRDHLSFDGQPEVLRVEAHSNVGVYIPNVSITTAWGLEWNKNYQDEWCKNFPDPSAHGCYLDMFFNNALIHRTAYIWVDGIKLPLPRPRGDKLSVTERACKLMKVMDRIGKSPRSNFNSYESDIARAGFTVIEEEWPTFRH